MSAIGSKRASTTGARYTTQTLPPAPRSLPCTISRGSRRRLLAAAESSSQEREPAEQQTSRPSTSLSLSQTSGILHRINPWRPSAQHTAQHSSQPTNARPSLTAIQSTPLQQDTALQSLEAQSTQEQSTEQKPTPTRSAQAESTLGQTPHSQSNSGQSLPEGSNSSQTLQAQSNSSQLAQDESSSSQTLQDGSNSSQVSQDKSKSSRPWQWWSKSTQAGKDDLSTTGSVPPDPDVVARQRWSWLLLGVGVFALGNWVCQRVLTWERYAEFAPGMVLTMKDHTRKQDIWEHLVPRYRIKVGFATGDGGLQDKRYAFTTDLTPLNRKLFEKVHYDGHAAMLPVLYDSADPTYCRLDDHNHYNLGKVLMYVGVWVAFLNAAGLVLMNLAKVKGWAQAGGLVFREKRVAPAPLEVAKQAA